MDYLLQNFSVVSHETLKRIIREARAQRERADRAEAELASLGRGGEDASLVHERDGAGER